MKNIILACILGFLMFGFNMPSHADTIGVSVPVNGFGSEADIKYAGVKAVETTTEAEVIVSSGAGVVYGVLISSSANGSQYIVLRDTDAVNASGDQILPTMYFASSSTTQSLFFTYPIRYTKGLTVTCAGGDGAVHATVLYLKR